MTRRGGAAPLLTLALAGCAAAPAVVAPPARAVAPPRPAQDFFVAGYHPYWADDAWLSYPNDVLAELFFFELEADADGSFLDRHGWPEEWPAMVGSALADGVRVSPTISMHDPVAFQTLFADPVATDRLVDNVVSLLDETPGLAGVHLDFEVFQPVTLAARDGFTAFVAALAERLRSRDPDLLLSVFALAFDDDDVYNERALAPLVDYLVVQGYDYHSVGEERAGPLAALSGWGRLNWASVVDRFASLQVPRGKMLMSVPLYGYRWPVESEEPGAATRGEAVILPLVAPDDVLPELPRAFAEAERYGVRRDAASGSPYYVYRDGSGWHQAWFEDTESLRAKYDFVKRRGLGGIAIFPLAYGDERLWRELRAAFPPAGS